MNLERVMRIRVRVEAALSTGHTPDGEHRVIPFADGSFEGTDLRGTLLAGGTDWQRLREDQALEIRAHYMLQTDQGECIEVQSNGLRVASREVLARLGAGEDVPPSEYYFRTAIRLHTGSLRLAHLNDRIYVGSGVRKAREVEISVYAVP